MTYKIEFSDEAFKEFGKLDKYIQKLIDAWIRKHLESSENPRSIGKPLAENKSSQWHYRIGDFRFLCLIEDDRLIISTIKIGHRETILNK